MARQTNDLTKILTKIVKSHHPYLNSYNVKLRRDRDSLRPTIEVGTTTIRIPASWDMNNILVDLMPLMDRAILTIEYDAHAMNDRVDAAILNISEAFAVLQELSPGAAKQIAFTYHNKNEVN